MSTHPQDKTPAGLAAEELQTQLLSFLEKLHPDNWRELADKRFVPMSNDLFISGERWAGFLNEAETGGREMTAHGVTVVAWAYCVEAIHKNRGAQPVASVWRAIGEGKLYFGIAVGRANSEAHGERLAASLFDK